MDISVKPLMPDLLEDYLFFFDNLVFTENPDWSQCYCYSFHFVGPDEQWNKEDNRSAVIKLIDEKEMTGYLAYSDDKPIGWCNANDRLNYQRLLKYYDLIENPHNKVCSIVCFVVHSDYRRKSIARKLLEQVIANYSKRDYDYIEAYPGIGHLSCERLYKGPSELYKEFGFRIEREVNDYLIVRKKLR